MIYFDNSSTTKVSEEVLNEILETHKNYFANSSSLHNLGFLAEQRIIQAKKKIAKALFANENEIYFTSCGTESNNSAILGAARAHKKLGNKLITSKIEHPSVLDPFKKLEEEGFEVIYLDVDEKGYINLKQLENEVDEKTILVSIMHINNEIGTVQPIKKLAEITKGKNTKTIFHTDAVQAFGKFELPTKNIDLISISGHKIHAPKGVGALYVKKGTRLDKIIYGSSSQNNFRAGTLNNEGINALGLATEICYNNLEQNYKKVLEIKNKICELKNENLIDEVFINGDEEGSSPYILSLSFDGVKGEVLLHSLEQKGIFVSTGSACSSRDKSRFSTIHHINKKNADSTIRLSFSPKNSLKEAEIFNSAILEIVPMLRMFKKR